MESFVILYNKRMIQKVHPLQISAFHAAEKIPGVILPGIALAVFKLRQRKFFQRTFPFDSFSCICYNDSIRHRMGIFMKAIIQKSLSVMLCLSLLLSLVPAVSAENAAAASDITADTRITGTGYDSFDFLTDGDIKEYHTSDVSAAITLENPEGIAGIYLLFDLPYGAYTVTDNRTGNTLTAGELGFLHEFLDLDAAFGTVPTSVTLDFANGSVQLSELSVYSPGEVPNTVQVWDAPLEGGADLVLFSTHGDDDQLYFAGLLPYYAGELGCRVQVVYLTDHRSGPYETNIRAHEMLNGLWNVGVTAYPVFGEFEDFRIDDLQGTYDHYLERYGVTQEELQSFVVEQVRRFKPLVAVGHDLKGEYGHGMHRVYADLLTKALDLASDPEAFPESAEQYGTWQISKLYLHLYEENPITLDYDRPLEHFGGMTAFEVTQKLGFPCHETQYAMFRSWLYGRSNEITQAVQIKKYNPCKFGLCYSNVGEDVAKNDFLENITTYAEQERLEQERLEQERLEQERLEQERLEQERLEQERLEQERLEQERLEQEKQALEARNRQLKIVLTVLSAAAVAVFAVLVLLFMKRRRRGNRKNIS